MWSAVARCRCGNLFATLTPEELSHCALGLGSWRHRSGLPKLRHPQPHSTGSAGQCSPNTFLSPLLLHTRNDGLEPATADHAVCPMPDCRLCLPLPARLDEVSIMASG